MLLENVAFIATVFFLGTVGMIEAWRYSSRKPYGMLVRLLAEHGVPLGIVMLLVGFDFASSTFPNPAKISQESLLLGRIAPALMIGLVCTFGWVLVGLPKIRAAWKEGQRRAKLFDHWR